ncbi:hypothetical protein [uncultured Desulfovibrio sp.]|uniref:hypothetical protein n=1 Tax=uncultured Desulfovibrio sp. TaxID=167968 RepID=UPI00272B863D|nr:hypothetical protein [uncultured Desulfovibrio sp.]
MATAKEKQEDKANEAEKVSTTTQREHAEDLANKAEAVEAEQKRKAGEPEKVFPPDHNGQNRRISSILRGSRKGENANVLRDENRKLKNEVRRLQAAQADSSVS